MTPIDRKGAMQVMNALQREGFVEALALSRARIGELERDAVDRKGDADESLRLHLERYKALVLAIAQVIWTRDPGGDMVVEQPSWAAYTGQAFSEYVSVGWLDAVHPDDRAATVLAWDRAVATTAPYETEHRLRRHDGEYRYFSVRAVPVVDDDGVLREWAGIHTDITERRLTERTLREG
jgi:PAS domain S-box-containing protein